MRSFKWKSEHLKDTGASFRKWFTTLKSRMKRKPLISANVDHEQEGEAIVLESPRLSQVVDEPTSPRLGEIATASSRPAYGEATTAVPQSPWDLAYERLRKEKREVVVAYEELLSRVSSAASTSSTTDLESLLTETACDPSNIPLRSDKNTPRAVAQSLDSRRKMMDNIIYMGQKHMDGKQIAFKIGEQKFVLRDQMQYVVAGIQVGKDWIGEAVKASPLASTAWAGVCLLLPLLTNPSEVQKVNDEGLAYVTQKIQYYTAMESRFLSRQDEEASSADVKQLQTERLVELYQAIIDFQVQSTLRFFRRRFSNLLREVVKWDPWEEMLKTVKELGDNLEREEALGALVRWTRDSSEDKCLQCFKQGDYAWYKDRIEDRVPDTCRWFLTHTSYQSWLKNDSGPLLVSADPGCGKSVLARYLINSNFAFKIPKEAAICYFFFKEGDQNTISLAFCALIHQLLCLRPHLMRHALARYKQEGEKLSNNVTALWNVLEAAAADPEAGTIIIVLDALDECLQDEHNMATLSRYIRTHFEQGPKTLKILMTSRPYQGTVQHIQELEDSFPNIRIHGEDESETIRNEISSVIEFRIHRMKRFNDVLKRHLKQRLLNITHWTYLWVYLVFSYLESAAIKSTTRGLDEVIENLPTTVEEAYEKILNRSRHPDVTRKTMLILLAAYRPLTLVEMQAALELDIKAHPLEELDLESDDKFKDRLRDLCGLFITVHDGKVYFLHQTAREFLLPLSVSLNTTATPIWAHTFSMREAHMVLAESCVIYLDLHNFPTKVNTEAYMLEYSDENWAAHFYEADIPDGATILPVALRIYSNASSSLDYKISGASGKDKDVDSTNFLRASMFGHTSVARLLLDTDQVDADVNCKDKNDRTPLHYAVNNNNSDLVQLLLDTGQTDVDCEDKGGRTPLCYAAFNNNNDIAKLLLNTGQVDVNCKDENSRTVEWVFRTHYYNNSNLVKLLLNTSQVNVNYKDIYDQTPFSVAIGSVNTKL
ncbi:hypothetical protein F5Y09DRAFT_353104 [Xylaria sp. FL1042]|nr:hypothetical protein F5Y09DRAFT_353104 [Xylaria sp. FL1042]